MTRRSKREIENVLNDLDSGGDGIDDTAVVYRDDRTGHLVDEDGKPVEHDPDADLVVIIEDTLVMLREQAEREGREILGRAEDAPTDAVRVAREDP